MRILSRKAPFPFLVTSIRRISPSRVQLHSIRSNHSTSAASKFATKRPSECNAITHRSLITLMNPFIVFPERLLIYHAGTGRSVFLGCLRVTTIFVFAFFTLVVAPTHLYAENEPLWITGAGKFKDSLHSLQSVSSMPLLMWDASCDDICFNTSVIGDFVLICCSNGIRDYTVANSGIYILAICCKYPPPPSTIHTVFP